MNLLKSIIEIFKEIPKCDRCGFVADSSRSLLQHKTKKRKNGCPLHKIKRYVVAGEL